MGKTIPVVNSDQVVYVSLQSLFLILLSLPPFWHFPCSHTHTSISPTQATILHAHPYLCSFSHIHTSILYISTHPHFHSSYFNAPIPPQFHTFILCTSTHLCSDYTLYLDSLEQQSVQGLSGFSIQLPTSSGAGQQPVLFVGGIDSGVVGFQELQGLSTFQGCMKDFGYNYR